MRGRPCVAGATRWWTASAAPSSRAKRKLIASGASLDSISSILNPCSGRGGGARGGGGPSRDSLRRPRRRGRGVRPRVMVPRSARPRSPWPAARIAKIVRARSHARRWSRSPSASARVKVADYAKVRLVTGRSRPDASGSFAKPASQSTRHLPGSRVELPNCGTALPDGHHREVSVQLAPPGGGRTAVAALRP